MYIKTLALAAAITLPMAAQAATINGQLDITGIINLARSDISAEGNVDFDPQVGKAVIATGDFADINTIFELGDDTDFALFDIDFMVPEKIYEGGGFTFTATRYFGFDADPTAEGFKAAGLITGNGFEATKGLFSFSVQDDEAIVSFSSTTTVVPLPAAGFLLLGGLGAMAAFRRRA